MRGAYLVFRRTTPTPTPLLVPGSGPGASPAYKRWRVGTLEGSHADGVRGVVVLACGAVSGRGVDQQCPPVGQIDNSRDLETEGNRRSSKGGTPRGVPGFPCKYV